MAESNKDEEIVRLKMARIKEACIRGGLDFDAVVAEARIGKYQFHDTFDAVAISTLQVTAQGEKICYVVAIAGVLDGLREVQGDIEDFAKATGCHKIKFLARKGFEKLYTEYGRKAGYVPVATEYEKIL